MDDQVHWVTCSSAELPEHDEWLGAAEREHLATLRFPKRRNDWRLGRWTAKQAVQRALGAPAADGAAACTPPGADDDAETADGMDRIQIVAADDGAPEAVLSPAAGRFAIALSISHSAGRGFAAASTSPMALGCDVEHIEPRTEAFIADFFAAEELPRLDDLSRTLHRDLAATLIWSAKESALKALRTGLRADTRSVVVEVDVPRGELSVTSADAEMRGWWWVDGGFVHTLVKQARAGRGDARGGG